MWARGYRQPGGTGVGGFGLRRRFSKESAGRFTTEDTDDTVGTLLCVFFSVLLLGQVRSF